MKKHHVMLNLFQYLLITILGGAFLCIVFASCENFLKGAETKKQLDEAIEIANANPVSIYADAEEGSGTVTISKQQLKKKESFEVRFKPATGWRFIKWEVRDRQTKEIVTDVVLFDDETALETKGKLLIAREGLEVYAKAVPLPSIIKVSPEQDATVVAYTPIKVKFNMPVDDSDGTGEQSIFNYKNISITNYSVPMDEFFEEPVFNEDKTELTIMPKPVALVAYAREKKLTTLDLTISFSSSIVINKDELELELMQNEKSTFSFKYDPVVENKAPQKIDFVMSRTSVTPENVQDFLGDQNSSKRYFVESDIKNYTKETVLQNRTTGQVYIYGRFVDDESGIKSVTLTETYSYSYDGRSQADRPKIIELTPKNTLFLKNGNNIEFYYTHNVQTAKGAVLLSVSVKDFCENISSQSLFVFKVDSTSYINSNPYNYEHEYAADGKWTFNLDEFNATKKKIYIHYRKEHNQAYNLLYAFGDFVFRFPNSTNVEDDDVWVDYDNLSIICTYMKNNIPTPIKFTYDEPSKTWVTEESLDVDSLNGLKINISMTDDIKNSVSNDYTFPSFNSLYLEDDKIRSYVKANSENYLFFYKDGENQLQHEERFSTELFKYGVATSHFNDNYSIIPYIQNLVQGNPCRLYGDIYTGQLAAPVTLNNKVEFKSDPVLIDYNYFNGSSTYYYGITFTIADDSWNKFDYIYYTYKIETQYDDVFLPYGTYNATIGIMESQCSLMNKNNIDVTIYGIKNSQKSLLNTKTVYTASDIVGKYDKDPPNIHIYYPEMYKYELSVSDSSAGDSGLDKIVLYKNDGSQIVLLEAGNVYVDSWNETKPILFFEEIGKETGFVKIEATDKNGNSSFLNIYYKKELTPERVYGMKKTSYWTLFRTNGSISNGSKRWYFRLDTNESDELYWKNIGSPSWTTVSTDDTFIKFLYHLNDERWGYRYFYTCTDKAQSSSGKYNYVQALSDRTFLVASDAPTLVHTIKTDKSYEEYKNWCTEEWELYGEAIGEQKMDFSTAPGSPQTYTIPAGINSGEHYVVVAYFADCEMDYGEDPDSDADDVLVSNQMKSFMSEVMVK